MNRYLLSGLISLFFLVSTKITSQDGQRRPAEINILNAESMEAPYQGMGSDGIRLIGNVLLRHEDVLMQCDSAHRYANTNMVYAFGNVHINQGDTIHLYGDRITYYGNRRFAEVRQNVRLMDQETTLYTEYLDFNLQDEYGYYPNRGVVISGENRLESVKGYYYTRQKLFYFQDSVRITNPDYVITSDTLKYNTVTEVAYFLGPTTIIGEETNIYCENGWYNTQTDIAQFNENARINYNNQVLSADSLYFDNKRGRGEAFMNLSLTDTVENIVIKGNYGWFVREPEEVFVTDRALFIQMFENDTMYLHADTLRSWTQITYGITTPADGPDILSAPQAESDTTARPETIDGITTPADGPDILSAPQAESDTTASPESIDGITTPADGPDILSAPQAESDTTARPINSDGNTAPPLSASVNDTLLADTIPTPALILPENDTVRVMVAYYGVRIFSNDMQGKCDSLYYNMRDSIIYMFQDPVIWSDESQLTAEIMELHSRNGEMDRVIMKNSAFIVSEEDPGLYNQIKGNDITGYFRDGELFRVNVSGNAETLYYPTEGNDIIGINKAASSRLIIFLKENKPDRIRFLTRPEATMYPMDQVPSDDRLLQNFQWLDHIRPKNREDVFNR